MSRASSALVPVAHSPAYLTPRDHITSRLIVDRTISTTSFTLYVFTRGPRTSRYARDAENSKDLAMITVNSRDHSTFKLSYWPKEGDAQIVEAVRASELDRAISDLVAAGFPCHAPARPSGPVAVAPVAPPMDVEKSHTPLALYP